MTSPKIKVLFGTPTYDYNFCAEYVASMLSTCIYLQHHGIEVFARYVGGMCFIDIARNDIVKYFLESDATDLFFVDADVGFDYKAVKRFLEYPQEIVAGMVHKRTDTGRPYHDNALTGECVDNLIGTIEAPTAFMRLKRSVFAKIDKAHPEYADYYTMDKGKPYFQTGFVNTGTVDGRPAKGFQGEDIYFCRQWIAMGERIWFDPDVEFSHRGQTAWRGKYVDYGTEHGILIANGVEPISPAISSAA